MLLSLRRVMGKCYCDTTKILAPPSPLPVIDNKWSLMLNTLLPGERNCESKESFPRRKQDGQRSI